MSTLPHFKEKDMLMLESSLGEALRMSEASLALLVDRAGFLVTHLGSDEGVDLMSLGALSAGAFAATQAVATELDEEEFNNVYHQGKESSTLVQHVDEDTLLIFVFSLVAPVSQVKYYGKVAASALARTIKAVRARAPEDTVDLANLNLPDSESIFGSRKE